MVLVLWVFFEAGFVAGVRRADGSSPIKHVVVLMQENRAFDHVFGWSAANGGAQVNGLTGQEYNLLDPADPDSEKIFVSDSCPYLNECDPGRSCLLGAIFHSFVIYKDLIVSC